MAAAHQAAEAARLEAEVAAESIRAKAAAEAQAKAVSRARGLACVLRGGAACLWMPGPAQLDACTADAHATGVCCSPQAIEVASLRQQLFEQQRAAREAEASLCTSAQSNEELQARVALLQEEVAKLERWGGVCPCGCVGASRHAKQRLHCSLWPATFACPPPSRSPLTKPPALVLPTMFWAAARRQSCSSS